MPAIPVDEVELQARIESLVPEFSVAPITELQGGASSITYWTTLTKKDGTVEKVVVKVAPAGLEPSKNRDVLRQARVLEALKDRVPVPTVLAKHAGGDLPIPPFFIMSFEVGECVEPNFIPPGSIPAEDVRGRTLHAAEILGVLHQTDPEAVNLADEVPKTLREEVEHWINSFAVCDEDLREGTEDVGERLLATLPEQGPTTLIHGDYRLGNTLSEGPRVISVIDWEIWARSDARVDLAWFLMMSNPDAAMGRSAAEGMPANEELLSVYEHHRGAAVKDLEWFDALVRYKQAAAGALIARNARRRGKEAATAGGNGPLLTSARQLLGIA
jgi:aminoglycoside phosphotransferase (APT) family kinase protein